MRSTILTSQLPVSRWHEQIGDPTLADGILDRLVHNAHRIEMRGESPVRNRLKTLRDISGSTAVICVRRGCGILMKLIQISR